MTAAGTTNFIWDGQDVLLETDVSNNTQVTYTQTPNMYGDLVSQRRSTTTKYYHFDGLGSTLALTDSGENVTDTYKYYAFGNSLASTGATVNNLRFVGNLGYYNEAALSLQYLRARYYQPGTGRFVSVDPIRDGLNWYVYVANSPVGMVDPSGLKKKPKPCEQVHEHGVCCPDARGIQIVFHHWLPGPPTFAMEPSGMGYYLLPAQISVGFELTLSIGLPWDCTIVQFVSGIGALLEEERVMIHPLPLGGVAGVIGYDQVMLHAIEQDLYFPIPVVDSTDTTAPKFPVRPVGPRLIRWDDHAGWTTPRYVGWRLDPRYYLLQLDFRTCAFNSADVPFGTQVSDFSALNARPVTCKSWSILVGTTFDVQGRPQVAGGLLSW